MITNQKKSNTFRLAAVMLCTLTVAVVHQISSFVLVRAAQPTPTLVADINPAPMVGSSPIYLTIVGDTLFFIADDGSVSEELWKFENSIPTLVKDIAPGVDPLVPTGLTAFNGKLYFTANDSSGTGEELWVSDGTITGTVLLKDIHPTGNSNPTRYTQSGNALYFQANDGSAGYELWKTDGTVEGTMLVKDIYSGSIGSSPTILKDVNGILFFVADDGIHGAELFKSDGTITGTQLVKDIYPVAESSTPRDLTVSGNRLYFRADDGVHGEELWVSDGSEIGTVLLKDILSGTAGSSPGSLTEFNGEIYFGATTPDHGHELWKSDGTEIGTVLLKDIVTGTGSSIPVNLSNGGDFLYFTARLPDIGRELHRTDGTPEGTQMVKDINPGQESSIPLGLIDIHSTVIFRANDGSQGYELWKSQGTAENTELVEDIYPGAGSSNPASFKPTNGYLYFTANDGATGTELWALELANELPTVDAGGPYSGIEGELVPLVGQAADDGELTIEWTSSNPQCSFADPKSLITDLNCPDNDTISLTLEVRDWWNLVAVDQVTATIFNSPPEIISMTVSQEFIELGAQIDVTLDYSDSGVADIHTATIDWGDGESQNMDVDQSTDTAIAGHIYENPGEYVIIVIVEDDDGGADSEEWALDLVNQIPIVDAGGPYSGIEGEIVSLEGQVTDDGEPTMIQWTSSNPQCIFTDPMSLITDLTCPDNDIVLLTLEIHDLWNVVAIDQITATIFNSPPEIETLVVSQETSTPGSQIDVTLFFSDQGVADTHTATIAWGDGESQNMDVDQTGDNAVAAHAYDIIGEYVITITLEDDDGAVDSAALTMLVVESKSIYLPMIVR